MVTLNNKINKTVTCENCITGEVEEIIICEGMVMNIFKMESKSCLPLIGPGLIDLQINGVNKIDFNIPTLKPEDLLSATHYLLSQGITSYFPTIITNSDEAVTTILHTIHKACISNEIVQDCIAGIHLEGPFISPKEGAKGAHDERYIKAPDWNLFKKFQEAAGGRIKIITIAPEWEGSEKFIKECLKNGVTVSIGHSLANSDQIKNAVKAGATMSTHLGNAVPLLLPRHPNLIWDQLAEEQLYTCLITDGIHIPDSFIKTVLKVKGDKTLVISDATCFAGMPPGEYKSHIGGTVILDNEKRVSLKGSGGLLAGAAKTLLENVETLINREICSLSEAWKMASVNVTNMLSTYDSSFISEKDLVIFDVKDNEILIQMVIKNGKVVFEQ